METEAWKETLRERGGNKDGQGRIWEQIRLIQGLAMCHLNRGMKGVMVYMGKSILGRGNSKNTNPEIGLLVAVIKFDL